MLYTYSMGMRSHVVKDNYFRYFTKSHASSASLHLLPYYISYLLPSPLLALLLLSLPFPLAYHFSSSSPPAPSPLGKIFIFSVCFLVFSDPLSRREVWQIIKTIRRDRSVVGERYSKKRLWLNIEQLRSALCFGKLCFLFDLWEKSAEPVLQLVCWWHSCDLCGVLLLL